MNSKIFQAFTTTFNGKAAQLKNNVEVSLPYHPGPGRKRPPVHKCLALWDTGATNSVVTKKVAKALNLKPASKKIVRGVHGEKAVNVYYVNIRLPNRVEATYLPVTECENISGDFCVIIGMDIIGMGDFSVTNDNGKTVMSFRLPSIKKIDYVEEANKMKERRITNKKQNDIKRKRKQERKNRKKGRKK